ncbi:MAG: hypothetical protein AAGJ50_08105 [Pseudomonadota bacterium]
MRPIVVAFLILTLSACGQTVLFSDLDEREANEVVATLRSEGLTAHKSHRGNSFLVKTRDRDFASAVDILNRASLPRRNHATPDIVFGDGGFAPQPLEMRAKLEFAKAQELERMIEAIEGVTMANAIVSLPERPAFGQPAEPASAAVFIHHHADYDITHLRSDLKLAVARGIEGLTMDTTKIVFVPVQRMNPSPTLARPASLPTGSGSPNILIMILCGLVVLGAGGLLAVLSWDRRRVKQPAPAKSKRVTATDQSEGP